MKRICSLVLLLLGLGSAPAAEKPNVLFIASDDLNDWIGALGGHPQGRTPNIDRLMKRGVMFRNAHCAAPACNPSRAALMTGLHPTTSGVYLNSNPWRPVLPDAVTLPQHFSRNGYLSGGAGKIYHGRYEDAASWDHYLRKGSDPKPSAKVAKDKHSRAGGVVWGVLDAKDEEMNDYKMVSYCIEQLQKKQDQPFFLACGIYRPHMPWQVPRKYYDMFPIDEIQLPKHKEDDLKDLPPAGVAMARPSGDHANILKTDNWKYAVQGYLASMTFTDAMVGRLMDAFDKSAHAKNTIIVFWTDHGWHLGEKKHWRKFALWEEATRVPLLIAAPGVTKPNQICDRPVSLIDLYPTLIDLCGLPQRSELDGQSLVPLLKNPKREWERPVLTTHGFQNHTLRTDRYRFIQYANGDRELYDHRDDPMEYRNLAKHPRYADRVGQLSKSLPKKNAPEAPREQRKKKKKK
ncbi:MAG: sulfatase [Limisphaerales bacterium]